MTEDVYEPLARYRDEFKERFAALAREKFEALTAASGIDVESNRATVAEVRSAEAQAASAGTRRGLACFGLVVAFLAAAGAAVFAWVSRASDPSLAEKALAAAVAAFLLGLLLVAPYRSAAGLLRRLRERIERLKADAWAQMAPLNALYTWDITPKLIEATVPRLAFDPYFTVERLSSLKLDYGWSDGFNRGKSVEFAQSGVINGNPFVFGQYLAMSWGRKTYTGRLDISWTDWEADADGRRRLVRRHETLHASVEKPVPVYTEEKVLVYGNDAAPALSFSREPSGLTGREKGFFGRLRAWNRLRKLRAYSRNLDDESNFTLMSNEEFETWFNAPDRDNEVEFRVLFTPVAQTQMLLLMKDGEIGYGDDFGFRKEKKINYLRSVHLDKAVVDTDPARFRNWDYDAAAAFFMAFNEKYFRDAYFSLAPLLAIPAYQQVRSHADVWKGVVAGAPAAFWEHEAIANYHGEGHFRHPQSVTRNILKTELLRREDGESVIAVTAHGYRGEDREDLVSVHGGDGLWHDVPVEWVEYLPVRRTRELCVTERETPSETFRSRHAVADVSASRRSILSYLVR